MSGWVAGLFHYHLVWRVSEPGSAVWTTDNSSAVRTSDDYRTEGIGLRADFDIPAGWLGVMTDDSLAWACNLSCCWNISAVAVELVDRRNSEKSTFDEGVDWEYTGSRSLAERSVEAVELQAGVVAVGTMAPRTARTWNRMSGAKDMLRLG